MRCTPFLLAGLVFFLPGTAGAQPGDAAGQAFRERLRAGDRVTLLLDAGVMKGKLDSIEAEHLVVKTASGSQRVPFASVREAGRQRRGFLLGTIIGLGVGAGCGAALGSLFENEGGSAVGPLVGLSAAGAVIGGGLDALINLERTVYRRQGAPARVSLGAGVRPGGAGIQASVQW